MNFFDGNENFWTKKISGNFTFPYKCYCIISFKPLFKTFY